MAHIIDDDDSNTIQGTPLADHIEGRGGDDTIYGFGGANSLDGGTGEDSLEGSTSKDTLRGGTGDDTMKGGDGDDTYYVDSAGDVVIELAFDGAEDLVFSSVGYTLDFHVENLTLTGSAVSGFGSAQGNRIIGNAANNSLWGLDGNDFLDGGVGNDFMAGGNGDDIYRVDSPGDGISELAGAGTDRVISSVSYTLSANVENLDLTGSAAATGVGNALNNSISGSNLANLLSGLGGDDLLNVEGSAKNDTLNGGAGSDTMKGGTGNDTYYVDNGGDSVTDIGGIDRVISSISYTLSASLENLALTGAAVTGAGNALGNSIAGNSTANSLFGADGNDVLSGGADNDFMNGGAGDDSLNGGAGDDFMMGSGGNDIYYVDAPGDIVSEGSGGAGVDKVSSSVSHGLGADIENLVLTGAALVGNGNALNNAITGNGSNNSLSGLAGNDSLNGAAGNDFMAGGLGNDTYYVDATGDTVSEGADAGIDRVFSSITHNPDANVENVTLTGSTGISSAGNLLDNAMTGNGGNNALSGSDGNDRLFGFGGSDSLFGGNHDDVLNGGIGNDSMSGGTGKDILQYSARSLGSSDVTAGVSDIASGAVGDRIDFGATVEAALEVNGIVLSAAGSNQAVASSFNADNNVRFAVGRLQIDLNGDFAFTASSDFEVRLTGVSAATYNSSSDMFFLT